MAIVTGRPTSFSSQNRGASRPAVVRSITGSLAGESTTRTVAQFPASLGFACGAFDSLLVGIELGSGSGDVTLEPLVLDADGALWLQIYAGAASGLTLIAAPARVVTPAIAPGRLVEVPVWGQKVLFRVDAVTGTLTDLQVIAYPGRPRLGTIY
jgi:hypothetical protein